MGKKQTDKKIKTVMIVKNTLKMNSLIVSDAINCIQIRFSKLDYRDFY